MLKRLFTLLFIFYTSLLFSQKIKYTGGVLKLDQKNHGKNVSVEYDSFFDSYLIFYTNVNGYRVKERYDGSRIQKWQIDSKMVYFRINGTRYSIEGLKQQK